MTAEGINQTNGWEMVGGGGRAGFDNETLVRMTGVTDTDDAVCRSWLSTRFVMGAVSPHRG